MKSKFIVATVGLGGYWGRGNTLSEAAETCLKAGARRDEACTAWLVLGDDQPVVDGMGAICRAQDSDILHIGEGLKLRDLKKLTVRA